MSSSRGAHVRGPATATPANDAPRALQTEGRLRLRHSSLSLSPSSDDPPEFRTGHRVVAASGTKDVPPIRKSQRIASRLQKANQVDSRAEDGECDADEKRHRIAWQLPEREPNASPSAFLWRCSERDRR